MLCRFLAIKIHSEERPYKVFVQSKQGVGYTTWFFLRFDWSFSLSVHGGISAYI